MAAAVDSIQQRIAEYASSLTYEQICAEAVYAAKARIIDTLGALVAAFFEPPCRTARNVALRWPAHDGASLIGTRLKCAPEMAAFANATTARFAELTDSYHWPGAFGGHPSDTLMPILAAAESLHASGTDYIASAVLAYEIYCRIDDVFDNMGFDQTICCCLATAIAAGKLLKLTPRQFSHCISMAMVTNNALRISRTGHLSTWKVAATGQAGRAGIFAARLAHANMEGPHLPFEGKAGWCDHVALKRFALGTMGGSNTRFKILDTSIKMRPCVGYGISPVLAAEKLASRVNVAAVQQVMLETYQQAKDAIGTQTHHWQPDSKETADHSAAYLIAASLMDGTITPRSYSEARLCDPRLRALMQKVQVVANDEFTAAYNRVPSEHRARVTVVTYSGHRLSAEAGASSGSLSAQKSDAEIDSKFRSLTEDALGGSRVESVLKMLWRLEDISDVAEIPPALVFT